MCVSFWLGPYCQSQYVSHFHTRLDVMVLKIVEERVPSNSVLSFFLFLSLFSFPPLILVSRLPSFKPNFSLPLIIVRLGQKGEEINYMGKKTLGLRNRSEIFSITLHIFKTFLCQLRFVIMLFIKKDLW